jgi:hypothetical protein
VDVRRDDGLIDVGRIEAAITPRTRAILPEFTIRSRSIGCVRSGTWRTPGAQLEESQAWVAECLSWPMYAELMRRRSPASCGASERIHSFNALPQSNVPRPRWSLKGWMTILA